MKKSNDSSNVYQMLNSKKEIDGSKIYDTEDIWGKWSISMDQVRFRVINHLLEYYNYNDCSRYFELNTSDELFELFPGAEKDAEDKEVCHRCNNKSKCTDWRGCNRSSCTLNNWMLGNCVKAWELRGHEEYILNEHDKLGKLISCDMVCSKGHLMYLIHFC